jgi:hypothetical protein
MSVLQLGSVFGIIDSVGPSWGWAVFLLWTIYQVYNPLPNHQTAFQSFRADLTARMDRHEIGQITLAEQVDGADAEKYRQIHDKERLTTADFLDDDPSQPRDD